MSGNWQFWIDVGGTFTDCLAMDAKGSIYRYKVLSSGVTKGQVHEGSSPNRVLDPLRANDPEDFWVGFRLKLLAESASGKTERVITDFDRRTGALVLDLPLEAAAVTGQQYELTADLEAPILAIRFLLKLPMSQPIPPVSVRLGTTRGTNALITRRGAATAFVTTKGFGDILRIGYQNRPRLFDLAIEKPEPLASQVVEIDERTTPGGDVLTAPDENRIRHQLGDLAKQDIQSLGICLLNSYCQPQHEQMVARIAREVGFDEISVSSQVAPLVKLVSRGDTTVVDAYLNPVLRTYVNRLRDALGDASELRLLTSAGGLVDAERFVGKDSILSGPAGGVVGFSKVAGAAGFSKAIGFDMGGTSTDVSRFDGRYELEFETEKAGVRVVAPMMAIETVAAGGGSICRFDGVKLAVGPDSAGADPGPACYGRGGPLAVTDLNFYLGKIPPEYFPFPLDRQAVEDRLRVLCEEVNQATGTSYTMIDLARGLLRVANANMAKAIRSISVAKGYDPRDYLLIAFGGAAPQHACAVAKELGITRILNHPDAGILSAYGIGLADVVRHQARGVYQSYSQQQLELLEPVFSEMAADAGKEVADEGVADDQIEVRRSLDLRYQGLDASLNIACPSDRNYKLAYEEEHRRLYGYVQEDRPLEIVAARVEVIGRSASEPKPSQSAPRRTPTPIAEAEIHFDSRATATPVYQRAQLKAGDRIVGPAIVAEKVSTTVIDPGWQAEVLTQGELLLEKSSDPQVSEPRVAGAERSKSPVGLPNASSAPDPIMLEVFNNQFAGIAEQMGITLRDTSSSVNVKERLDFSCALFTPTGDLVVNAPHIPVHLGAMGETVKQIIADNPDLASGDVIITNDPYRGGSHLPDVTVVTPVFDEAGNQILFFTASRAHHAEIGGITPGSMPPFSKNLAEEGVVIRNFKVVAGGRSRLDELRELLINAPYPTRNVTDNLADISAQVAANESGSRDLLRLIGRYTLPVVQSYMGHIQDAAEQKMRLALSKLDDGTHRFVDHLDDGSPIAVAITVKGDSAVIDFTDTGPVLDGNLNANRAIVTAAVMYCLRCLIAEDIPLNQGVLAPVEIVLPLCLLNPPAHDDPARCPAIVGGNVETSQRIVDVVLGALGIAAASQGTVNNVVFGDESFGYYETICGGSGATPDRDGADAVHVHMTNTRLTDPEVLEQRYPVRVREFSIRRGSGGKGRHRGGDGVIRKIEFLRKLKVSILSQRRGDYAPYGKAGGEPGARGDNLLVRAGGARQQLGGQVEFEAQPGDVLVIKTPGGGGFGEALDE